MICLVVLCSCLLHGIFGVSTGYFPKNFMFGVATASYQVEGGWNENGKGENIWDRLTHQHPESIANSSNGDVACDSYHRFEEDIQLLEELGVHFYRFSLSWSRLLPTGYLNEINPDGVRYYNDLIDGLLARGIIPLVTLYHWDLPQPLQDIGGWPNKLLVDFFVDYARFAFQTFGDRVKMWISFNEPPEICQRGYGEIYLAPALPSDGIATYMCSRTLLLAHAQTYHVYDKEFKPKQKGKLGITISADWFEPETSSSEDFQAAEKSMQMSLGWWAHPIFSKEGDYPEIMKESIDKKSKEESFPRSRLIPFTEKEVAQIRGSFDFFGLNHYTTRIASANFNASGPEPSYIRDVGVKQYQDQSWPASAASWLKRVPWGFRKLLQWIKKEYDNPEVYVTENGYADKGELKDTERVNYMTEYLKALLDAILIDNCNVVAYTHWSLMDNFEWIDGYTLKFGLVKVDFNSPNRTRTKKYSFDVYKRIIQKNSPEYVTPTVQIVSN